MGWVVRGGRRKGSIFTGAYGTANVSIREKHKCCLLNFVIKGDFHQICFALSLSYYCKLSPQRIHDTVDVPHQFKFSHYVPEDLLNS